MAAAHVVETIWLVVSWVHMSHSLCGNRWKGTSTWSLGSCPEMFHWHWIFTVFLGELMSMTELSVLVKMEKGCPNVALSSCMMDIAQSLTRQQRRNLHCAYVARVSAIEGCILPRKLLRYASCNSISSRGAPAARSDVPLTCLLSFVTLPRFTVSLDSLYYICYQPASCHTSISGHTSDCWTIFLVVSLLLDGAPSHESGPSHIARNQSPRRPLSLAIPWLAVK